MANLQRLKRPKNKNAFYYWYSNKFPIAAYVVVWIYIDHCCTMINLNSKLLCKGY